MFNKRRRKFMLHHEEREIQITPFIDVVLVLLIVFMIASPAVLSGIDVDLPSGNSEQNAQDIQFITVSVNRDGDLYLDDDKITNATLISAVRNKIGESTNKTIFIRGDKIIKYGDIMSIIDTLNRAGYSKTILVTNKTN